MVSTTTEHVIVPTSSRRCIVDDGVVCAELNDEAILLNVTTGVYYGLNGLGTVIWQYLVEGLDEAEINTRLLAEYEVAEAQLAADVSEFLNFLTARDLVHPAT